MKRLKEKKIDDVFRAVIECTQESVLNSMLHASKKTGIKGHKALSIKGCKDLPADLKYKQK